MLRKLSNQTSVQKKNKDFRKTKSLRIRNLYWNFKRNTGKFEDWEDDLMEKTLLGFGFWGIRKVVSCVSIAQLISKM